MKYALICGSESGLAKASINVLDRLDYTIFCCDIAYNELSQEGNKYFIPIDITSTESIKNAYEFVKTKTDKLDIISNFAGIVILGSLVELPPNTLDKIVSINLLGTYKVNNIFFDMVFNAKGRIINISSEYDKICGVPFHGYYGITKHAIKVYNDSLRRELLPYGIKVVKICPGAFKTNMQGGVTNQFEKVVSETKLYKDSLTKMKGMMVKELEKAKPTTKFEKVFYKAATSKKPKLEYKVNNSFKMKLLSALPRKMQDWAFKTYLK